MLFNEVYTQVSATANLAAVPLAYAMPVPVIAAVPCDWRLSCVSFHASVAINETFTITMDNLVGANYDTVIAQWNLINQQNVFFSPDGELSFFAGNTLLITCTNANLLGNVYVTVTYANR